MDRITDSPPAIHADHLHKRYGDRVAVDDVSFTLEVGETLGIVGANGAGKTTTVEMVGGASEPGRGTRARTRPRPAP